MPCRCADHGHVGRDARGGLVQRREVVQVQDVGVGGAGVRERPRPGGDLVLVACVVERSEDAVGRARAVLVGGCKRRVGEQRVGRRPARR